MFTCLMSNEEINLILNKDYNSTTMLFTAANKEDIEEAYELLDADNIYASAYNHNNLIDYLASFGENLKEYAIELLVYNNRYFLIKEV